MPNNKLLASGLYSLVQNVLGLMFGFGGFILLARLLPKDVFGTWALFMTTISLIEVARNGLVQNAKIKFLKAHPEQEGDIMRASLTINIGISVLSAVLLGVGSQLFANLLKSPIIVDLFWIYGLTTLTLIPFSQINVLQQSRLNFGPVLLATLIRAGLFFSYIAYHFWLNSPPDLHHLAVVQLICAALGSIFAILGVGRDFVLSSTVDWGWVRRLLHFGKFVFGTNVSAILYSSVDQYLLAGLTTKSVVADYNAAVRINTLAEVPVSTAASILYPYKVSLQHKGDNEEVKTVFYKGVGAIVGLLLPVVLLCWAIPGPIMLLIAGPKYLAAAPLLPILACCALLQPFLRQFGTQMDSSGHPHINFGVALSMAFLNFALNYFFILRWGAIGAASATLTTQLVFLLIAAWLLNRFFQIKLFRSFQYLFAAYEIGLRRLGIGSSRSQQPQ